MFVFFFSDKKILRLCISMSSFLSFLYSNFFLSKICFSHGPSYHGFIFFSSISPFGPFIVIIFVELSCFVTQDLQTNDDISVIF